MIKLEIPSKYFTPCILGEDQGNRVILIKIKEQKVTSGENSQLHKLYMKV